MDIRTAQQVMFAAGFYRGAIDGRVGAQTEVAASAAMLKAGVRLRDSASATSKVIAGAQAALSILGHDPGPIDGIAGARTRQAIATWRQAGSAAAPTPAPSLKLTKTGMVYPLESDMPQFYGEAGGPDCTAGKVKLPFPFVLAWNTSAGIVSFSCHRRLEAPLTSIFRDAAAHYGRKAFEDLGLNLFGGCYNFRKKRGGTSLSTHAYGAAVDIDPARNGLKLGRDRAQLAKPEYEPFWNIVEAHGGVSLGRLQNYDWMHFQFARKK